MKPNTISRVTTNIVFAFERRVPFLSLKIRLAREWRELRKNGTNGMPGVQRGSIRAFETEALGDGLARRRTDDSRQQIIGTLLI